MELAKQLANLHVRVTIAHIGDGRAAFPHPRISWINYAPTLNLNTTWLTRQLYTFSGSVNPLFYSRLKYILEEEFDIIQLEQPYVPYIHSKGGYAKRRLVLDSHNVEVLALMKRNTFPLVPYGFILEALFTKISDIIFTTSYIDKNKLKHIFKVDGKKLIVIPNGVNCSRFYNIDTEKIRSVIYDELKLEAGTPIIFFHGTLSYYPNYQAAKIIIDKLSSKLPDAVFLIAGKDISATLRRKAQKNKKVILLDYVADIGKYIAAAHVCIAPILAGSGTRLKILEYMAAGMPIVATEKAVEGLNLLSGMHALIYPDVGSDFVKGIREVLLNENLAKMLGENARKFAQNYDWSTIALKAYNAYCSLLKS